MTKTKMKEVNTRLITADVMGILEGHGMLNKVEHVGLKEWNGKQVMVNKLTAMTLQEQEELEKEIREKIEQIL